MASSSGGGKALSTDIGFDPELYDSEELGFRESLRQDLKIDLAPYVEEIEHGETEIWDVIRILAGKGYMGIIYPPEVGGLGKSFMEFMLACEELSALSLAVDMSMTASSYGFGALAGNRNPQKYLKPLVAGEKIGAFCYTEPEAGSDLGRMKATAVKDGDGYVINAEKRFITNGSIADYMLVYTRNGAFVVEADREGFEVKKEYKLMGLHGLHLGHLLFNRVWVPQENAIFYVEETAGNKGKEHEEQRAPAMDMFGLMLAPERSYLAAEALGVARAAFQAALKYSTERIQFKKPICEFEAISFKLADMVTAIKAMRLMVVQTVRELQGNMFKAAKRAAMTKLFCVTQGFNICNEALQVLGGIGYTADYPVERYLRDIRLLGIGGGTNEMMRYVIQRDLYKEFSEADLKQ
jgi:alkylation response protein AidB-like acyl-CoA dehydrogenase